MLLMFHCPYGEFKLDLTIGLPSIALPLVATECIPREYGAQKPEERAALPCKFTAR